MTRRELGVRQYMHASGMFISYPDQRPFKGLSVNSSPGETENKQKGKICDWAKSNLEAHTDVSKSYETRIQKRRWKYRCILAIG